MTISKNVLNMTPLPVLSNLYVTKYNLIGITLIIKAKIGILSDSKGRAQTVPVSIIMAISHNKP